MKDRVVQLCGDIGWPETFDKLLLSPGGHGSARSPTGSPFAEGGIVVIESATGLGNVSASP